MFSPPFPDPSPYSNFTLGYFRHNSGNLSSTPCKSPKPQTIPLLCLCTGPSKRRYSLSLWPEKPHLFQEDLCGCLYPSLVSLYPTFLPSSRAPLRAWRLSCPRTPCCALARVLPSSLSLFEGAQPCQGLQPCPLEPLLFLLPHRHRPICSIISSATAKAGRQARLQ